MSNLDVERRLTDVLHRHAEDAMSQTDTQHELREFLTRGDQEPPRALGRNRFTAVVAAGVAAAAALPGLDLACGLATAGLLAADVTHEPMLAREGRLPVRPVAADEDLLARWEAAEPRRAWWLQRLARCHAVLVESGSRPRKST